MGSQSKARYKLLRLYNAEITVISADIDESFDNNLSNYDNVKLLAKKKAEAILSKDDINDNILICADTIVIVDNKVLNKPKNYDDAFKMIKSMMNNHVEIVTGIYIQYADKEIHNFYEISTINFEEASNKTIEKYLQDNSDYLEIAGALNIEKIEKYVNYTYKGSYTNIIGLPMEKVSALLYDRDAAATTNYIEQIKEPITIFRSSVRSIIKEKDKIILLNGYTFDKKYTFLMSIGGGYHRLDNKEEIIKKEAQEEGGLIIDKIKPLTNITEFSSLNRYIEYNKMTLHTYYFSEVKDYTNTSYIEYEQELLIGIERHTIDDAIEIIKRQVTFFDNKDYCQITKISMCDLEALNKVKIL